MATNIVTHITPGDVLSFIDENPELCSGFDPETDEGFRAAHALLVASLGGEADTGVKAPREAQVYDVFLVTSHDGALVLNLLGSAKGSVGKPASDPTKYSPLQRLEIKAMSASRRATKAGVPTQVFKIPAGTLPSFGPVVETPAVETPASE